MSVHHFPPPRTSATRADHGGIEQLILNCPLLTAAQSLAVQVQVLTIDALGAG